MKEADFRIGYDGHTFCKGKMAGWSVSEVEGVAGGCGQGQARLLFVDSHVLWNAFQNDDFFIVLKCT